MFNSNSYSDKFHVRLQLHTEPGDLNLFNYEQVDTVTLNYGKTSKSITIELEDFYEAKKDEFLNLGVDRFYAELSKWFRDKIPSLSLDFIVFSSSGNCIRFNSSGVYKVRQSILHAEQRAALVDFVNSNGSLGTMPPATYDKVSKPNALDNAVIHYLVVKAVGELKAVVIITSTDEHEFNLESERLLLTLQQGLEHYFLQKDIVHARFIAASAHRTPVGLLSCISHELRTPLNSIIGFAGLFAKEMLSGTQRDYISCIQSSGQKLLAVVTDLIDMADIEQGRLTSEHFDINVPELLARRKEHFSHAAALHDLDISTQIDASVPEIVIADGRVLDKVVFHLIDSAIVHSTNGVVTVSVTSIDHYSGQGMLELKVSAPGFGGLLNSIFRETPGFEELTEHNTHGLTIVNAFVQLASGDIRVSTLENGYTCYQVLLPFEVKVNQFTPSTEVAVVKSLAGLKCLVVEDNLQNAKLITKLLTDRKIISDHALNGKKALELIDAGEYDFVLMDLQMPEMDGFETVRHIRERTDQKAFLPVMVITANATPGIRFECRTAGFNAFLNKPFGTDDLFDATIQMLTMLNYHVRKHIIADAENIGEAEDKSILVDIDLTYLKSFSAGDEEFEKDMLTSSGEDIDEKMQALALAFSNCDARQVKELAHSLKSLFSIAGFNQLNEAMCSIENDYRYNLLDDGARALYESSAATWQVARKLLDEAIAKYH